MAKTKENIIHPIAVDQMSHHGHLGSNDMFIDDEEENEERRR
jgi:hypothetical protein